ncbi:MAG TPA: serine/threonine-protein kinase, partial [Gemmatimonadales bacterium]|nr:serine/threonine-protein kinase [Gemmatimonadales bacterium]
SFAQWGPGVIGIVIGLLIALVIRSERFPLSAVMNLGLLFEVVSSYAIAAAEFADPQSLEMHRGWLGLSWVAVWVVLFTIVVPTTPRRALVTALASVSSVPVIIGVMMATGYTSLKVEPALFFIGLVFPYLLVAGMAYVGARVVYQLGTEVKRARELGSYRLEEKLGEGGMGEVWRARHRMLARPAAIKLIRRSEGDGRAAVSEEAARRFEREAQVIARLRSPHTVELFDFGRAQDGAFYYVMELLEGLDADSLVRRFGPIPAERAIYLLRQVCHSLSEAQSCGLVHRDIKPANIFLCRYGEEYDFVKVLDFGIVGSVRNAADPTAVHTQEHAIRGTPAFIAPEQALGGEVDGRADIYATGCLAYWLLTGQLVFTAETQMGLLMHHAKTAPAPPSTRTDRPISRALDELVLSCLAKDPADRPQSARELSHRLAEMDVASSWTEDRASSWWATHLQNPASLHPEQSEG